MSIFKEYNSKDIRETSFLEIKNFKIGRLGEEIAKKYLQSKKYVIIDQNYRTRRAEIDLIVLHKRVLVFIEVRTKRGEKFGRPEESINRNKIIKLINSAKAYAARKKWEKKCRIDAVCIVLENNCRVKCISHYENIAF